MNKLENKLPISLIEMIYSFFNPYRELYKKGVLIELTAMHNKQHCLKQLKQHVLVNQEGDIIQFQVSSILDEVNT